jgi:GT2 family glycosyltransferase
LRRKRFDVAYLNFYGLAEYYLPDLRALSPVTRIIIDTHDVHYLRERRGAELSGDPAALAAAERTREREAAIYSQTDLLTAVSEDDAVALRELAPGIPVEIVSNVHVEVPPGPGFDARNGLIFVANFDHAPNVDAILDFHATSWALIAEAVPAAQLMIVGYAPPPSVTALAGERITVTGQVPEVAPYLDAARISIAPLRYGAGVKGKVGEALMHGLPVVTTPIGAEGMDLVEGEHTLIAEAGEDFARAVIRLYDDGELWQRIAEAGRAHIDVRHGVGSAVASLRRAFATGVPTMFLADLAPWSDEAAAAIVRGYVQTFSAADPVSLVIPITPSGPDPEAAVGVLAQVIEDTGVDPDQGADIAVMPCAVEEVPLPSTATLVGAATDWAAIAARGLGQGPSVAPSNRPRASIVIPAYGRRELTENCLASLDRTLGERLGTEIELVLVDNASPDSTLELFESWQSRATVVALPRNLNFAGGVNAGARAARGATVLVLSTDMEFGPGAIDTMIEEAEKPGVGMVGARLLYPDGRIQHAGGGWRPRPHGMIPFHLFHYEPGDLPFARATLELSAVTGGCIAMPAELFELLAGFDEGYVNGWEDADLCMKVRSAGAVIRYRGDVNIVHHEGGTSGASYHAENNANPERFQLRWGHMLSDDTPFLRGALGAGISPIIDLPVPDDRRDGASVRLAGPVAGIGPRAGEARGVLRALEHGGSGPAARTIAPTWIGPALDERHWSELAAAHSRPADPGAATISFGEPENAPRRPQVLRVSGYIPDPVDGAVAWAACPAVADRLRAAGWPDARVELVAPVGIDGMLGPGGQGVLVLAPTHDQAATEALLAELATLTDGPIRVLPTVRTPAVRRLVDQMLPGAELLTPATDEGLVAALAADSDLVIAGDTDDEFDRFALIAAASGAAVAVRADGPGAWVLGEQAITFEPFTAGSLSQTLARAVYDGRSEARRARADAVLNTCGVSASADALRRALARRADVATA